MHTYLLETVLEICLNLMLHAGSLFCFLFPFPLALYSVPHPDLILPIDLSAALTALTVTFANVF